MGLFRKPYSRRDSLSRANEAQSKGKPKKAISEYEKIIEHDGEDAMVLHKLAMSMAMVGRLEEARAKFVAAAELYEGQGFEEKALAVFATASHYLPEDIELRREIAERQLAKGRAPDAIKILLDGRSHLRGRKKRAQLVDLLERVRQIDEWHFIATFELAATLLRMKEAPRARALYEALAERNEGRSLRKVRGALFRMSPTPAAFYRWLRALVFGR